MFNGQCSDNEEESQDIFKKQIYEGSNFSQKGQNDLLTLLRLHLPENVENNLPRTYKELLKRTIPTMEKTQVCAVCTKKIAENNTFMCENGHCVNRKPTKDDSFFIDIPMEPQLKTIIEGK